MNSARVLADSAGQDEVVSLAELIGKEEAFRRLQLDVVLGTQREEEANGLKQIHHSWRVEQNGIQPNLGTGPQVGGDDTREWWL